MKQKSVNDSVQASVMKRHEKHRIRNTSMVQNFKLRIADFLKEVSATPLVIKDHYGGGFQMIETNKKRVGPATFNFGASKGDRDRLEKCNRLHNDFIDHRPATIERIAWNMRPRSK